MLMWHIDSLNRYRTDRLFGSAERYGLAILFVKRLHEVQIGSVIRCTAKVRHPLIPRSDIHPPACAPSGQKARLSG